MRENQGADAATGPQPLMPRQSHPISLMVDVLRITLVLLFVLGSVCSDKARMHSFLLLLLLVRASADFFLLVDEFLTHASFASRAIGGFIGALKVSKGFTILRFLLF